MSSYENTELPLLCPGVTVYVSHAIIISPYYIPADMPDSSREEKAITIVTDQHIEGTRLAMENHLSAYTEFGGSQALLFDRHMVTEKD